MILLSLTVANVKSSLSLCIVSGEQQVAQDHSGLDDLCRRLQLPDSTVAAVKRLMSVLYSLGVVQVKLVIFVSFFDS